MTEDIDVENGYFRNFDLSVTLTLTSDDQNLKNQLIFLANKYF